MASPRFPLLFAVGLALGAFGWHLVGRPYSALPSGEAQETPSSISPSPRATTASGEAQASVASDASRSLATANVAPEAGLRLWEALALRGAPSGNAGKWITPPKLTASYGDFGTAAPDSPISPEFVEFFDLTPGEQNRLQTLLRATLQAQHEMDVARIRSIESRFRIKQAIEIPAYAETSAPLRQSYETELRAILGEGRFQVYRDWAGDTFKQDFPGLAGMNRQYHFIPPDDPATAHYQVVSVAYPAGTEWTGHHATYVFKSLAEAEEKALLPLSRYFKETGKATEAAR